MSVRDPYRINIHAMVNMTILQQIEDFARRNNYRMSTAVRRLIELGLEREFYSRQAE